MDFIDDRNYYDLHTNYSGKFGVIRINYNIYKSNKKRNGPSQTDIMHFLKSICLKFKMAATSQNMGNAFFPGQDTYRGVEYCILIVNYL